MAYYGNLALRPERVEEQQRQQRQQPARQTQKTKVTRRRSIPIGEKLLYLFTVGLVVFVAGFIIFRYAQIYQINGEIQATKKSIEQATEQSKELQNEVNRLSDPAEIRKKAIANGFVPIESEGITASKDDQNAVAMKP
ncbi:cell division protein FtsL [Cohnella cholangitidis]|uniref:Cell division protein FtsL n=1 Tax=Cohnella cholangitidis TaxID=2598458 RepID=A0A7G5BTV3_9BACL|nr:cell division protein FtsL [Cohnella cholangitidis]QMV40387.1 cell division protein FtsL [Cohnella cholangitidis]